MGLYEKTWESIDSRPLPGWFDEAKLGIFIHWGLYSVPAYAPKRRDVESTGLAYSEWYGWQVAGKYPPYYDFHRKVYGEHFRYEDFAGQWKAEMFDPDKWAKLFARAGAKMWCWYRSTTTASACGPAITAGTGTVWISGHIGILSVSF